MKKPTFTDSVFDGLNRKSGEDESTDQGQVVSLPTPTNATALKTFPVDKIFLGTNVRKTYTNLNELAESIKENGLLEPIGIEKEADPKTGKRKLVYGHRRFKAISEILKLETVNVVLVDSKQTETDEQRAIVQLIENIQREDISDSDLANSLNEIKKKLVLTNAQLAKKFSKSESWIKKKIDHSEILEQSSPGNLPSLPTSFVSETMGLPSSKRIEILTKAENENWTRNQIIEAVSDFKKSSPGNLSGKSSQTSQNQNRSIPKSDPKQTLESEIKSLLGQARAKIKAYKALPGKKKAFKL